MGRSIPPKQPQAGSQGAAKRRKSSAAAGKKKGRGRGKQKTQQNNLVRDGGLLVLEYGGLLLFGLVAVIVLLGHFGNRFSGTDVFGSLLPFGASILGFIVLATLLLSGWKRLRRLLKRWSPYFPAGVILVCAVLLFGFVPRTDIHQAFGYYRVLVGGREEAGRMTLAHQVYAAYRRLGTAQTRQMIERSLPFTGDIEAAADTFRLDPDLLKGLAAAESSYLPRKSLDGGHGLYQITQAPKQAQAEVDRMFRTDRRDLADPRYNAFLGAATLRHYLDQMNNDLFLGLLAYNIGPANGGLRFIMQQYGATDFVTIQPYLLQLPRDYPIRVLSYGLAFRIQREKGRVLAYEEDDNAIVIQALGIPGL